RLTRVELWEISIVTFPMLSGARISGLSPSSYPRSPLPGDTAPQLPPTRRSYLPATDPLKELTATIRSATRP
ncbi:MAG: HK97 family phage prohead protease, partial [Hyphomicrobiaceae bacterium]|nr:HK97 family phage prohead protease [Hyphomicrobiaceae bacterium]